MVVKVIGWSCRRTEQTLMNAQAALNVFQPYAKVEWVDDIHEMNYWGMQRSPSIIVDGKVKAQGRIPSVHEITTWIEEHLEGEFDGEEYKTVSSLARNKS